MKEWTSSSTATTLNEDKGYISAQINGFKIINIYPSGLNDYEVGTYG
jgi:hypothetical protein